MDFGIIPVVIRCGSGKRLQLFKGGDGRVMTSPRLLAGSAHISSRLSRVLALTGQTSWERRSSQRAVSRDNLVFLTRGYAAVEAEKVGPRRASRCGRRLLPTRLLFRATNVWEANFTASTLFQIKALEVETCRVPECTMKPRGPAAPPGGRLERLNIHHGVLTLIS